MWSLLLIAALLPATVWSLPTYPPPGCIEVPCENSTATVGLNKTMLENRSSCEHRLYDENNTFLGDADKSGQTQVPCEGKIYLRSFCDDKEMDLEVCFKVKAEPEHQVNTTPVNQTGIGTGAKFGITIVILAAIVILLGIVLEGLRKYCKQRRSAT